MTTVSGIATQTAPYNTYTSHDCDPGNFHSYSCHNNDWCLGTHDCPITSADQNRCSNLDPGVCPGFSSTAAATPSWAGTASNDTCTATSAQVQCTYPATSIAGWTLADVQKWQTTFGQTPNGANDSLNQVILRTWCSQPVSTCPTDPATGRPMAQCSRLVSNDATEGPLCRTWETANAANANNAKLDYCGRYNTPDCACINRAQDPIYAAIQRQTQINPRCWYTPCAGGEPPYLNNLDPCTNAPTTVCQTISNIINSSDINVSDAQQHVTCGLGPYSGGGVTPAAGGGGVSSTTWIILGAVLIAVLIAAAAAYFFLRRKGAGGA